MDKYKEGIVAALTEPSNFDAMWEIYDLFPSRRDLTFRIAQQFVAYLESKVQEVNTDVSLRVYKEIANDYAGVYIDAPGWEDLIALGFEFYKRDSTFYTGIWFQKASLVAVKDTLVAKAAVVLTDAERYVTGVDWLRYKLLGSLDSYDDVRRLIAPARDETATEYSAGLYDLTTKSRAEVNGWLTEARGK